MGWYWVDCEFLEFWIHIYKILYVHNVWNILYITDRPQNHAGEEKEREGKEDRDGSKEDPRVTEAQAARGEMNSLI